MADAIEASKKRVVIIAVAAVAVLVLLGVAYAVLGGSDLIADLMGGTSTVTEKPQAPSKPSTPPSTPSTSEPTESVEPTGSAEPAEVVEPTDDGSGGSGVVPSTNPPTGEQAARMYWEQVASQEQIGKLVRGEVAKISIGSVAQSGSVANVRLTVTYTNGSSLSGTMVLRNYGGAWYFSSIARDGNPLSVTTGKAADLGVVQTIVNQQASNQDIVRGIVSGAYKTVTVNGTSMGSGTATVRITVGGGSASPTPGSIVCVSKTIGGTKHWFITSFSKN